MKHNPIIRETTYTLVPTILLYGLYVQFHGNYGPGGGFQAGMIFTIGLVLYAFTFGVESARRVISMQTAQILASLGIGIYILVGFAGLLMGGEFLNYSVLATQPLSGQHAGVLLIELGVGITIVGVVMLIFYLLMAEVDE
ncbi:MAG: Na(+)/H(+) antiporter subunit B [Chromatiales bacterium]|nr:Na(+)/H(+) antiporter subunit B [Chromatiales bacterium]